MEYKVLGINSGLGVSLFPFKKFVIGNLEQRGIFHTKGNEQWKLNFHGIPLFKDKESAFCNAAMPNIIISSPDCGSGSILRYSRSKKLGDHKKNQSLTTFFYAVNCFKVDFFLFENLETLFKSFPESEFDEILKDYFLVKHISSVSVFGNSQKSRKRLIIVGIRKTLGKNQEYWERVFRLPKKVVEIKTCWELYGDLYTYESSGFGHVREPLDQVITIYAGKKLKNREIRRIWREDFKGKKRFIVTDRKFTTAPGVYRNLDTDYPATARKANRQYDGKGNMLTPRQLARVQGVPDNFKLFIDPDKPQYWINKARTTVTKTPPFEISQWFKRRLDKFFNKTKTK